MDLNSLFDKEVKSHETVDQVLPLSVVCVVMPGGHVCRLLSSEAGGQHTGPQPDAGLSC